MRYLRYGSVGNERPGLVDADGNIRDISGLVEDVTPETIGALPRPSVDEIAALPIVDSETRIGPCVRGSSKFVCVGLNYADHVAESGARVPDEPIIFMKANSAICGPNDDVYIPPGSIKTDWEVELGVIVGKTARHVSEADALDYVAGYCLINDVTEREYQMDLGGQWDKGKSYDTFGPVGPWLVTPDEIADVHNLSMWLDVDGQRFQDANTKAMIFKVPEIISYISRFMSLMPGDIISTGTPTGVGLGQKPPVYLKDGQEIRLGIDGLGEQRQRTVPSPY